MNNEEKFKNKLHELLEEQYFTYDSRNWEKASKHLDEEETKKRRGLFIILSGLGLILGFLGYLWFSSNKDLRVTGAREITQNTRPWKSTRPTVTDKEVGTNLPSSKVNKASNSDADRPLKQIDHSTTYPTDKNTGVSPRKKDSVLQEYTTTSSDIKNDAVENSPANKEPQVVPANKTDQTITPDKGGSPPIVNAQDLIGSVPAILVNEQEPATKKPQEDNSSPLVAGDNKTSTEENKKEERFMTPVTVEKKDSIPANSPAPTLKPDTTRHPIAQAQPTLPALPLANYCYIEAGAFYNFGWKNAGKKEGNAINPYLGVSYFMHLTDKVGFSIGAYYTTLSGLDQTKVIKSSKVVFGEESTITEITPLTLNYIAIPVKAQYSFGKNQMITAGYTAGYMLDVQSKVKSYSMKMGTQQDNSSYHTGGYTEGFRTFNSQLSIGYRRKLYGNLWANAEFYYGLTDLRDNDFFGISLKEKATGFKLSLTYDMLKK